ncbi:hypothetical protein D3C81_1973930 [compost metagenome]
MITFLVPIFQPLPGSSVKTDSPSGVQIYREQRLPGERGECGLIGGSGLISFKSDKKPRIAAVTDSIWSAVDMLGNASLGGLLVRAPMVGNFTYHEPTRVCH